MTALHHATLKIGRQRNHPRIFVSARYTDRARLTPNTYITLEPGEGTLVVRRSESPTGKRVNPRRGTKAVIDLNERMLADVFGTAERVYVRVEDSQITLSIHPLDRAERERPRDGSVGSLFTGAGFLDEAARMAGLKTKWAVEIDERYADTFAANADPDTVLYTMSVHEAAMVGLPSVELLLAGIPCTPFSKVRTTTSDHEKREQGAGASDHSLVDMALWTSLIIARVNPRTVVIENTPAFAKSELGAALAQFLRRLGYVVTTETLSAHDHGCLSDRRRCVLVAQTPDADGTVPSPWPEPVPCTLTVADVVDETVPEEAWVTSESHPHLFERSESNREKGRGFSFQVVTEESRKIGTFTNQTGNGVLRVDQSVIAHPTRPNCLRAFRPSEGRRIHGVREDFVLPPEKSVAWEMVGQSVYAPLFARIIERATGRLQSAARHAVAAVAAVEETVGDSVASVLVAAAAPADTQMGLFAF